MPRQRRRGYDPTNPLCEALACLFSIDGYGNGALLQHAIPGRQYLSAGHGHSLCAGLSLLQVLLHPLPRYIAYSILLSGIYIFAPQGRPQDSAGKLLLYPNPRKRTELSLVVGEAHHARNQIPSKTPRWVGIPERELFTSIAIVGAVGSGTTASCMYPFARADFGLSRRRLLRRRQRRSDYCPRHTVMKAQAEPQRQSNGEKADKDQRTTTKEIALDH